MRQKVIRILGELRPEFDFTEKVNYLEQGMLDSYDVVNLVATLEDEFGISIDGMDILPENFSTIDKIVDLLKKYESNIREVQ